MLQALSKKILDAYGRLINMDDCAKESQEKKDSTLRSRAVTACAIFACTNAFPWDCADAITDGYNATWVSTQFK